MQWPSSFKALSDLPQALDRPAQRLLGVAARGRRNNPLQIDHQLGIDRRQLFAATADAPHPIVGVQAGIQIIQRAVDRAARDPGRPRRRQTPPQPAARASAAANKRRWRSSRNGRSAKYLARIASTSTTPFTYATLSSLGNHNLLIILIHLFIYRSLGTCSNLCQPVPESGADCRPMRRPIAGRAPAGPSAG